MLRVLNPSIFLSSEKNWMHPYKVSRAGAPVFGSMKLPSQDDDGREGRKV
jgi:hypothetical protein